MILLDFCLYEVSGSLNVIGYRLSIDRKIPSIIEVFSKQALCMLKYWFAEKLSHYQVSVYVLLPELHKILLMDQIAIEGFVSCTT